MENQKRTLSEELFMSGKDLIESIKKLVHEGNIRSLVLWSEEGKKLLEIPLSAGVGIGGAALLLAPFIATLGIIAATVKHVKVEIIRNDSDSDKHDTNSSN